MNKARHIHLCEQPARRGNTIVLVIGILVLLVIIATAFVARTQAGRVTAGATSAANLNIDNARNIGDGVAQQISDSLFVRNINHPATAPVPAAAYGSNISRRPLDPSARRFVGDLQNFNGDARPDFPYNTPPFAVMARTNWPDGSALTVAPWPFGPGNPTGPTTGVLAGEYNDIGNPGFGDCRWLRDLEPLRWDSDNDGVLDAFSHWQHMTNVAAIDNGWRIVFDISDVGDANGDGFGRLVTDMNVPVEQFLALPHNFRNSATGDTNLAAVGLNNFMTNWGNWLGVSPQGINGYLGAYTDPNLIPPNLLRLRDLDADGIINENGERPQDEFIGGAARWYVGRVLTDSDGDGYTDSFWFLAPTTLHSGIRQVVGVSIIDNSAMLNANVATRFIRSDPTGIAQETRGLTPTDLALVGQGRNPAFGNFNCGLYDTWENWLGVPPEINVTYDFDLTNGNPTNLWFRHLREVGLTTAAGVPLDFPNTLTRLDYWRRSASNPLSPDPTSPYTPFGLDNELELRMYAGQNYPWIGSRFEWSADRNINGAGTGPFRSGIGREESSEYLDQLFNRVYARDLRHVTTMYNGARNETMPPWLWLYGPNKDLNADGLIDVNDADLDRDGVVNDLDDQQLFMAGTWKFDLRLPYDLGATFPRFSVVGEFNGLPGFEFTPNTSALQFGIALRDRIALSLIDAYDNLPTNRGTYFGNNVTDIDTTYELAAAYAANVAQWRDREIPIIANDVTSHELAPLTEAVPIAPSPTNPNPTDRFLGMEPQPFVVEAYLGHIYAAQAVAVPPVDPVGTPFLNAGQFVVNDDDSRRSEVVVVQIANPFNRAINLDDPAIQFQVRVFGQEFDLTGLGSLQPATEDQPNTMVLFAIKEDLNGDTTFPAKWIDFLDIASANLTPNSVVVQVPSGNWDVSSRNTYDTSNEPAVEIRRRFAPGGVAEPWVTIDRMDPATDRDFGQAVNQMQSTKPEDYPGLPPDTYVIPNPQPTGDRYPGYDIGITGSNFDHWVQWVRATRAWGVDVDDDTQYDPNERNPRFVFGDYAIATASGDPANPDDVTDSNTFIHGGNRYRYAVNPDTPWFTRPYTHEDPANVGQDLISFRKPTFFDMHHGADPANPAWSFPDKGWYGQKGTGGTGDPDDPIIDTTTGTRTYRTPFAMQMLHKDGDFEQVGEMLNIFLYGHRLRFTTNLPTGTFTGETVTTFSEYMSEISSPLTTYQNAQQRFRTNRLALQPVATGGGTIGTVIGVGDPVTLDDPRHAVPDLPAGVRMLEGFVCDSWGVEPMTDLNGDGAVDLADAQLRTLFNAKAFDGTATPGLININTAPVVVARTAPDMLRLVHETGGVSPGQPAFNNAGQPLVTSANDAGAALPRVMLPEAIDQYRHRANGVATGIPFGADYSQVNTTAAWPRFPGQGIQTIGEILLMNEPGQGGPGYVDRPTSNTTDRIYDQQWQADMGITDPAPIGAQTPPKPFFDATGTGANQISMRVSTDRQEEFDPFATVAGGLRPDGVAGDAEEANMLFAGISNLVTTRSDVFTVYFRVRSFRQNTSVSPPVWDATNPEYIVDDSRYVMLVDRSGVNHPTDKPRILYFEKLPN